MKGVLQIFQKVLPSLYILRHMTVVHSPAASQAGARSRQPPRKGRFQDLVRMLTINLDKDPGEYKVIASYAFGQRECVGKPFLCDDTDPSVLVAGSCRDLAQC